MAATGWLDPELSPQQLLDRQLITAADMLSPLYAEADVFAGIDVQPGLGQATWTGFAPTIQTPVTVTPGLGQATWTGFAATIQVPLNVTPGLGQATWTGFAPTIGLPVSVVPGLGQA